MISQRESDVYLRSTPNIAGLKLVCELHWFDGRIELTSNLSLFDGRVILMVLAHSPAV